MDEKLKTEIVTSEYNSSDWALIYVLCQDYGWDLVQAWGWLVSVGTTGIPKNKLQELLELGPVKITELITKLAKTGLVEKIRYARWPGETGICLDWDLVADKYGRIPFCASQGHNEGGLGALEGSLVPAPHQDFQDSKIVILRTEEDNIIPTSGDFVGPVQNFMTINLVGEFSEADVVEIKEKARRIAGNYINIENLNIEGFKKMVADSKVGKDPATRARIENERAGALARAASYIRYYYINIIKIF